MRFQSALLLTVAGFVAHPPCAVATDSGWVVRTWQSDDGLPNNNVTDLTQTTDGYLWIATPAQLARFDGVQFEGFGPKHIIPRYDRKITALLATADGGVWLGMNHGPLLRLRAGNVTVVTETVQDLVAVTILADTTGSVWIDYHGGDRGAVGGILYRVKEGQAAAVPSSVGGGDSRSVTCDRGGRVWLARDRQLAVFRDGEFRFMLQLPERMTRLAPASDGGLWICAGAQLFHYIEGTGLEPRGKLSEVPMVATPTSVLEDHTGALWIGTSDHGLFRWSGDRVDHVPTSHPQVLCLYEDREANVWAGTSGGGLDRIEPQTIALETTASGLPFAEVRSLCEDRRGILWAVTQTGELVRRENARWNSGPADPEGPGKVATCVVADATGAVWIGTQKRALYRWANGHFDAWQRDEGLVSRAIYCLLVSRSGDVWIGGNAPESIQRWHNGQIQTIALPANAKVIRTMAEDARGTIWAGTSNGMLLRMEGNRAIDEALPLGGSNLSIRCLHATKDDSLWIGYAGWGLGRLKDGQLVRITSEKGLYDDQISQVVADDRGWLWLGADHGIFKIRQQEFDDVVAGRTSRLHPIHYGSSDGLPSLQANFGVSPGAIRSRDGRIWLPMSTALAVADPERVRPDLAPPTVLLKRIIVDDQTRAFYSGAAPMENVIDLRNPPRDLRLPAGYRRLEIEFTALTFAAPENVTFQYRLDGLDDSWTESTLRRSVIYSRLPAGRYVFHVKARNRDGVWNETGSGIAFTVAPFFWQTWWFQLTAGALFTTAVIAFARYISFRRLRRKLQIVQQRAALDRERARIAKDIHDDVGASLTQVALLNGLVQRDRAEPEKVGEHVRHISTAVRSVTDSLDEIVWAVNPRNDTLPHLINYVGRYAVEFLRMAGVRCSVELPEAPPSRMVSAEARHNLFLVTKEALNNIVRHAHTASASLTITCKPNAVEIAVRDNGCGFVEQPVPHDDCADGLRNMRQRMAGMGGECRVVSEPGRGTTVTIVLPWSESV
jgi:signal transduction histidine kinase/ligand-binding sensor domain-containing protein